MSQTKSKNKSVSKAHKVVTDFVLEALNKGINPWKKPFFNTAYGNPLTGSRYSGGNPFFLSIFQAIHGYNSNYFTTHKAVFKLWGKRGYSPYKDSAKTSDGKLKICPIGYYNISKKKVKDEDGKETEKKYFFPRYFKVINLDQLIDEAKELVLSKSKIKDLELDNRPIQEAQSIFDNWIDKPKTYFHSLDKAYYVPSKDEQYIPKLGNHHSSEEFYSTLFHESVHATGHETRLKRKGITDFGMFGDHNYQFEELVAEMGAAMLCQIAGIESTLDNSAAYIKGWAKKLKEQPTWIMSAANKAEKAARWILNEKDKK